jgi:EAL and modified HD-GYP domain-containing signal transduction protein
MTSSNAAPPGGIREIFLARQPILDRDQNLFGFELLFRWGNVPKAGAVDGAYATASVVANAFGAIGIEKAISEHVGFINFTPELLLSDVVELLPPDRVVLELNAGASFDERLIERLKLLRRTGFRIALDDVAQASERIEALRGLIDVVKLDTARVEAAALPGLIAHFRSWSIQIAAERIESDETARLCRELSVDLFQGYYFAKPVTISGKRPDPSKGSLLRSLSQIMGDTSDQQVEDELKRHPYLTFNLLRLASSPAFGAGRKIPSIKQSIVVVGRQQLVRWVQLLLYAAAPGNGMTPPLLHTAAVRARLMESIAQLQKPGNSVYHNLAFMTGILSLMDVLFGMPIGEILKEITIADEVVAALTTRAGELGELLELAQSTETQNGDRIVQLLSDIGGLDGTELAKAQLAAIAWADDVATS